jgi:hypothetical protein
MRLTRHSKMKSLEKLWRKKQPRDKTTSQQRKRRKRAKKAKKAKRMSFE